MYLSWVTPTSFDPVTGYRIWMAVNLGNFTLLVANTMSAALTLHITNLTAHTSYQFEVAAISALGVGRSSAPSSVAVTL